MQRLFLALGFLCTAAFMQAATLSAFAQASATPTPQPRRILQTETTNETKHNSTADILIGLAIAFGLYELFKPHHPAASPSPTAPPTTVEATPTPTTTPTPVGTTVIPLITKEECPLTQFGWIEPTQGVWQDDDFFKDTTHKELIQKDPRTYVADLRMAAERDTLLYGILRPVGQAPLDRRDKITIAGTTHYATPVSVKMRFTLDQGGQQTILYETPLKWSVKLLPPCTTESAFDATENSAQGIPPPPGDPFQFAHLGPYTIRAELYDANNNPTGLYTEVSGTVVETFGPTVNIVPVYSGKAERSEVAYLSLNALSHRAEDMASMIARYGPIYFPVPQNGLGAVVRQPRDIDDALARAETESKKNQPSAMGQLLGASYGNAAPDVVAAEFLSEFQGSANIAHVGRTIVLLRGDVAALTHEDAAAFTFSTKTIFATTKATFLSLLHEIVHTEESYLWSDEQMVSLCGFDYHNSTHNDYTAPGATTAEKVRGIDASGNIFGVAYGTRTQRISATASYYQESGDHSFAYVVPRAALDNEQALYRGTDIPQLRERFVKAYEIMGSQGEYPNNVPKKRWITQCTFRHLVDNALQGPQDPHLLLVRAIVAHAKGRYAAYFDPVYDLQGAPDPRPAAGPFSLVLRNGAGAKLASYPFNMLWHSSDSTFIHKAMPFSLKVPFAPGTQTLELRGPGGVLATMHRSASAPQLQILSPVADSTVRGRSVLVRWNASTANGQPALASVEYSVDGKLWLDQTFESSANSRRVMLARNRHKHWIRVIVTDGTRSTERTVSFKT